MKSITNRFSRTRNRNVATHLVSKRMNSRSKSKLSRTKSSRKKRQHSKLFGQSKKTLQQTTRSSNRLYDTQEARKRKRTRQSPLHRLLSRNRSMISSSRSRKTKTNTLLHITSPRQATRSNIKA